MNRRILAPLTVVTLSVTLNHCQPHASAGAATPVAATSSVPSYNPYGQRCALSRTPEVLPTVTELIDTLQFMGFVRTLPQEPLSHARLSAALYFTDQGTLVDAHVIETTLSDSLARTIVELAGGALREQTLRPSRWSVRLGFTPGAESPLAVARSEFCKPKPIIVSRDGVGAPYSPRGNPNVVDVSQTWIRLAVDVSEEGKVIAASLLDPAPAGNDQMIKYWMEDAVRRRHYYPALVNGKPVAMTDTSREQVVVTRAIQRIP